MLNAYKTPVILSVAKNPALRLLITIKTGFFATLRMTVIEVFGIYK